MKRETFVLYDPEAEYAFRFQDFLGRRQTLPFEIRIFTQLEPLLAFAKKQQISLLLIAEKAFCPEVEAGIARQVILLSDVPSSSSFFSRPYPCVYKYQSSAQVLREVMHCYGEEGEASVLSSRPGREIRKIGVYSPLGRCGKTTFAWLAAKIYAEKHPTLYLSLEAYGGILPGEESAEGSLSDLLYRLEEDEAALPARISSLVSSDRQLDYLPPVRHPSDLQGVPLRLWERLLRILGQGTAYERVVLDFGTEVDGLFRLLSLCDLVFLPVLSDPSSRRKLARFEALIASDEGIKKKLVRVNVPENHSPSREGREEAGVALLWGEAGEYTRAVLEKTEASLKGGT